MDLIPPKVVSCQRWEDRRESRRPIGEVFNPSSFAVEPIERETAETFVVQHHYSGSYPAGVAWYGLWRKLAFLRSELMGVVIFSVPTNDAVMPKYLDLAPRSGIELGRFVLKDAVKANGETWTLARAFRLLQQDKPALQGVVSMSDPMERRTPEGDTITPGHVGIIYQAFNGRYLGLSSARVHHLTRDGWELSPRSAEKIVAGDPGGGPMLDRLIRMGARKPGDSEDLRRWLNEVKQSAMFTRVRHPGKHVYGWRLDGSWKAPEPHPRRRLPKPDSDRLIPKTIQHEITNSRTDSQENRFAGVKFSYYPALSVVP